MRIGRIRFSRDLNIIDRRPRLCISRPANPQAEWIDTTNWERSVICFVRDGRAAGDAAVLICNFTPAVRQLYRVGVPQGGFYIERLNTDSHIYGVGNVRTPESW